MKIYLDDISFATKSVDYLRKIFSLIPITENKIEFTGKFIHHGGPGGGKPPKFSRALFYLPRHINHVTISGIFGVKTRSYQVQTGTTYQPGNGNVATYKTEYRDYKTVGSLLKKYIRSLPPSVSIVSLKFSSDNLSYLADSSDLFGELKAIFKQLPPSVTHFIFDVGSLGGYSRGPALKIYARLPKTVSSLKINGLSMDETDIQTLFSAIKPNITTLELDGLDLKTQVSLSDQLRYLHQNIQHLSLNGTNLDDNKPSGLYSIVSKLPPNLSSLQLRARELSAINASKLAHALSGLNKKLSHINLGDNGLLGLEEKDLTLVLSGLPSTIQSIRLCETELRKLSKSVSVFDLRLRLACLPAHINTLSFSNSNFFGLSITDFSFIVANPPKSITTLDLSGLKLNQLSPTDLKYLLSQIPNTVTKLVLKRNNLSMLDAKACKKAFSALHNNLIELDLRENGIDRLLNSQMNLLMAAFPDVVLLVEDEIDVRNDGVLTRFPGVGHLGLFKSQGRIQHQKTFAKTVLADVKAKSENIEEENEMGVIFPFVSEKWAKVSDQVEMAKTIVPSNNPNALYDCKKAVAYRIASLPKGENKLDLSCCGLNILTLKELQGVFKGFPSQVTSLSLRDNGFHKDTNTKVVLIVALKYLSGNIAYLDLSAHGFEQYNAKELKHLFKHLPSTVEHVSLSHEKALSPALHIAKRKWPDSYRKLTKDTSDVMQTARALLKDYTKNNSGFNRFLSGHWKRKNVSEVSRLIKYIDNGVITNIGDLLSEFDQINIKNDAGSLSRRLAFLGKASLNQPNREMNNTL